MGKRFLNDPFAKDRRIMEIWSLSFDRLHNLYPLFERIQQLPSLRKNYFFCALFVLQEQFSKITISPPFQELGEYIKKGINPPNTYKIDEIREIKRVLQNSYYSAIEYPEIEIKSLVLPLEVLHLLFDRYIKKFRKKSKKESQEPLAQLLIVGGGFYTITQREARAISSLSKSGYLFPSNEASHGITEVNNVFYKSGGGSYAETFEIGPEVEYAVSSLYSVFGSEEEIASTILIKISNIIIQESKSPKEILLQASYGITGEPLHEILLMIETKSYLERCLGKTKGNEKLLHLLDQIEKPTWLNEFFENHPKLKKVINNKENHQNKQEEIDIIYLEFRKICESCGYKKYPIEYDFSELDCKNEIKTLYHVNKFNLISALGLIQILPEICIFYENNKFKRAPLYYLTDLIKGINKIKTFYSKINENHWNEIPNEIENLLNKISLKNYSLHFLITILINPCKNSQKFIVNIKRDEKNFVKELKLFSISNDNVFVDNKLVKSILYDFNSLMNKKIDKEIKNLILSKGPENIILEWLILLEQQNQRYLRLFNQNKIKKNDLIHKNEENNIIERIPFKFDKNLINKMYNKLLVLIDYLNNEKNHPLTHWNILNEIQPEIIKKIKNFPFSFKKLRKKQVKNYFFNRNITPTDACKNFLDQYETKVSTNILEEIQLVFPHLHYFENKIYSPEIFRNLIIQGRHNLIFHMLSNKNEKTKKEIIESRDENGKTSLLLACSLHHYEICKLLIDFGADLNALDNENSSCLLLTLKNYKKNPNQVKKIISLLIESSKINKNSFHLWNKSNNKGKCPLHYLIELSSKNKSCTLLNEKKKLSQLLFDINQLKKLNKKCKCNCDLLFIDLFLKNGCLPLKKTILIKNKERKLFLSPLDIALRNSIHCIVFYLILNDSTCLKSNIDKYIENYFYSKPLIKKKIKDLLKMNSLQLQWKYSMEEYKQKNKKLQNHEEQKQNLYGIELGHITICSMLKRQIITLFQRFSDDYIGAEEIILKNGSNCFFINVNCKININKRESLSNRYIIDSLYSLLFMNCGLSSDICFLELNKNKKIFFEIYQELNYSSTFNKENIKQQCKNLNFKLLSELILSSFIFSYSNLTPDDFLICNSNKNKQNRLFLINHESAFDNIHLHGYKNFLLCLDIANKPLDESVVDHFLSLQVENLFLIWFDKLIQRNHVLQCNSIPDSHHIKLPTSIISTVYSNIIKIQELLNKSKKFTPIDILKYIHYDIGISYDKTILFHGNDPFSKFSLLNNSIKLKSVPNSLNKDKINNFYCPSIAKKKLLTLIEKTNSRNSTFIDILNQIEFQSDYSKYFELKALEQQKIINGYSGNLPPLDFSNFDYFKQLNILKHTKLFEFNNLILKGVIVPCNDNLKFLHLQSLELDNCCLSILQMVNTKGKMPILKKLKLSNIKYHENKIKNKNKNLKNRNFISFSNSISSSVSYDDGLTHSNSLSHSKELYRSIDIFNSSIEEIILFNCSTLIEIAIPLQTKFLSILDCIHLKKVHLVSSIRRSSSGSIMKKPRVPFQTISCELMEEISIIHLEEEISEISTEKTTNQHQKSIKKHDYLADNKSILLEKLILQNSFLEPYKQIFQIDNGNKIEIQNIPIPLATVSSEKENIYRVALAVIIQPNAEELIPSFIDFYKEFFSYKFSLQKIFDFFYDSLLINENSMNDLQNSTKSNKKVKKNHQNLSSWFSGNKIANYEIILKLISLIKIACSCIDPNFYLQSDISLNLSSISIIWKTFDLQFDDDDLRRSNELYTDGISKSNSDLILSRHFVHNQKENKIAKFLDRIGKNFDFITDLNVAKCSITDSSLLILLSNFKNRNLKSLHLSETNITDKSLFYIAENHSSILHLDVSNCDVTSEGAVKIAKDCASVKFCVDFNLLSSQQVFELNNDTRTYNPKKNRLRSLSAPKVSRARSFLKK